MATHIKNQRVSTKGKTGRGIQNLLFALILGCLFVTSPLFADEIPWDQDKRETIGSWDFYKPLPVVALLKLIFQPMKIMVVVNGKIEDEIPSTQQYIRHSPRETFKELCADYSLDHIYSKEAKTITFSRKDNKLFVKDVFYPRHADARFLFGEANNLHDGAARGARDKLLSVRGVKLEIKGKGIVLSGDPGKVSEVRALLKSIDEGIHAESLRAQADNDLKMRIEEDKEFRGRIETRIIPLRHVSVGPSDITFQGKRYQTPGIIDTLKHLFSGEDVRVVTREEEKEVEKKEQKEVKELMEGKIGGIDPTRRHVTITTVMPDVLNNQLIIRGTSKQLDEISAMVLFLDKSPDLVEVEVIIVQGEDQLSRELGIRWGGVGYLGGNSQILPTGIVGPASKLSSTATNSGSFSLLGSPFPKEVSTAGFLYQGTRSLLDATLQAMENANQLETIAAPRVITLNNNQARITNANNYHFVVTNTEKINSSLHVVNTGVQLLITPAVVRPDPSKNVSGKEEDKNMVRLVLNARNSIPTGQTGDTISTNEQEINTTVLVPEMATFVLGGLFNNRREEITNAIPLLGDLPLLGHMFKYKKSDDRKLETVFLITPRIVSPGQLLPGNHDVTRDYVGGRNDELKKKRLELRQESQLLSKPTTTFREEE